MDRRQVLAAAALLLLGWNAAMAETPKAAAPREVRFIYLVPSDRAMQPEYTRAIETAARSLQRWYAGQTGGFTFMLHQPLVEVARTSHTAAWYNEHPKGKDQRFFTWYNAVDDAKARFGVKIGDRATIWVVYVDAFGGTGAGLQGVACLPEHDLLGLVGRHPKEKNVQRWIGGLGHELGHGFGLPHAGDAQPKALMQFGYISYPTAYLTPADLATLRSCGFFFDAQGRPWSAPGAIEQFDYPDGMFYKLGGVWSEVKSKTGQCYHFAELSRDAGNILIEDAARKLKIRLPISGGQAFFSMGSAPDWKPLYEIKKTVSNSSHP